jgi:uncharacterized protein
MQDIDRIAPTREPDLPVVMYQNWHHLAFLHWEIAPAELQALLPHGLELDTFDGKAYAGLVPFTVTGARPVMTPPLPLISSFHEVNVRTYVHRAGAAPGVYFFSLDASSIVAVTAARALAKLPYYTADVDFTATKELFPTIAFRSRRTDERGQTPALCDLQYKPVEGPVAVSPQGTLEHFLLERYLFYTEHDHHLYRGRVHHQPYPIQRVDVQVNEETLLWAAGIKRSENAPIRHYAREVNVKVYPLERVT